jgi:hypothetical protein
MHSNRTFSAKLDPEQSFSEGIGSWQLQEREDLFRGFSRYITGLLESRKPRRFSSNRGLLNTRKLYQHSYNDQVFYRQTQTPNSDTTFVFLIDASGSMRSQNRMAKCTAVVSAFAKANHLVMNDKIRMEVFAKGTPSFNFGSFVEGRVPYLARVYSNTTQKKDYDKILRLNTNSPFVRTEKGTLLGGATNLTPEFLLLPALMQWCKKNITTKKMVIINLTDGAIQHEFSNGSFAQNQDSKILRVKYLRGIPNTTIFIDGWEDPHLEEVYQNVIHTDTNDLVPQFSKVLQRLIQDNA